jgi:peroxiredoxin Q/BCP
LCDTDRSIGLAYGAAETEQDSHAKRIAYLIDKHGVIRYAWDKVDVKSHATQALEQLAYL